MNESSNNQTLRALEGRFLSVALASRIGAKDRVLNGRPMAHSADEGRRDIMLRIPFKVVVCAVIALAAIANAHAIGEQQVHEAQRAWGDGIVEIGRAYVSGGDYRAVATDHVAKLYAYDLGPVLFKPTKAARDPFRETFDQALSYFVAGVEPEDHGFAINPWTAVRFENHGIVLLGETALAMGHYVFTDVAGAETTVEYTFAYRADAAGVLRIVLHHSSLPYTPN